MVIEYDNYKEQTPDIAINWLHDGAKDWSRMFRKQVALPKTAPVWAECTNEEKEQWEREHPQPEPIEE